MKDEKYNNFILWSDEDLARLEVHYTKHYKSLLDKEKKYKFLINCAVIFSIIVFISLTAKLLLIFLNQLKFEDFLFLGLAIFL